MNEDGNEADEFIEAPEDEELRDYESPENENPEAVQAMIGGGGGGANWVFPDLVRVQSNSEPIHVAPIANANAEAVNQPQRVTPSVVDSPDFGASSNGHVPRNGQPRLLDPPDVSLLSSTSSSSCSATLNHQNTTDLCNSIRQSAKLNLSGNLINGSTHSLATSSPNSAGSSSSTSSSISNSLSGLILNSTSSSSSNGARNEMTAANNHEAIFHDPEPSTSAAYHPPSTLVDAHKLNTLEREIASLEAQKALLQQQLRQRDGQIDTLEQALSSSHLGTTSQSAVNEEKITQRITDSFDRLNASLEQTLTTLEQRIQRLEASHNRPNEARINGNAQTLDPNVKNDQLADSNDSSPHLEQMLIDMQIKLRESQCQEMCSLFRNIFTSAVREIDIFSANTSTNPGASQPQASSKSNQPNGH